MAITWIFSTTEMEPLTLADLRVIVSATYDSFSEERQKASFELVKAAWENERKSSGGGI